MRVSKVFHGGPRVWMHQRICYTAHITCIIIREHIYINFPELQLISLFHKCLPCSCAFLHEWPHPVYSLNEFSSSLKCFYSSAFLWQPTSMTLPSCPKAMISTFTWFTHSYIEKLWNMPTQQQQYATACTEALSSRKTVSISLCFVLSSRPHSFLQYFNMPGVINFITLFNFKALYKSTQGITMEIAVTPPSEV